MLHIRGEEMNEEKDKDCCKTKEIKKIWLRNYRKFVFKSSSLQKHCENKLRRKTKAKKNQRKHERNNFQLEEEECRVARLCLPQTNVTD